MKSYDEETGRLDARRMAEYLNLPLASLLAALGTDYQAVYETPDAPALLEGLVPIKGSLDILDQLIDDRATILMWLNGPHPDLALRTPMQLILDGHPDAVQGMLTGALWGIPS